MGHPLPRDVHINLRARAAPRELSNQATQASGRNHSDFMWETCNRADSSPKVPPRLMR